ncbi:MAG: HEAT repeat domain-containing protein [Pyrinomonadaceae bacterium]|nr:HEAT repeat domain-containing protein [Pyrinomonadaceae bacterium]
MGRRLAHQTTLGQTPIDGLSLLSLGKKDLTPKPPFSSSSALLETTDSPVGDILSDDEEFEAAEVAETTDPPGEGNHSDGEGFDAIKSALPTRTIVTRRSKLSEEEIRLGEDAFRNALIELEALGKTAAEVGEPERAEKERQVQSENEAPHLPEEPPIEAASWRLATHVVAEEEGSGKENPQSEESPSVPEEALPAGDEANHGAPLAESSTSEAAIDDVSGQTPSMEGDLQLEEPAVAAPVLLGETASEASGDDLDLPPDLIGRLNSDSSSERSLGLGELARLGGESAFRIIARAFDEEHEDVRNAAAIALFELQSDRAASFARTLREGSPERRRRIGAALATSGLADVEIGKLAGQTREQGYEAFSLLFLMSKAGEVQPLLRAIEDHPNIEVRLTVIKLLALNGRAEIIPFFRRLAVSGSLPLEVRKAVVEAIYELGRQIPRQHSSSAKIETQQNF